MRARKLMPSQAEHARREAIVEEAEQRIANVGRSASEVRDWLTMLMGKDSLEDQLQWGDGQKPEEDEDGD